MRQKDIVGDPDYRPSRWATAMYWIAGTISFGFCLLFAGVMVLG